MRNCTTPLPAAAVHSVHYNHCRASNKVVHQVRPREDPIVSFPWLAVQNDTFRLESDHSGVCRAISNSRKKSVLQEFTILRFNERQ